MTLDRRGSASTERPGNVRDVTMQFAAKWGLEGFSESLALEIKSFRIRVTVMNQGRTAPAAPGHWTSPLPYPTTATDRLPSSGGYRRCRRQDLHR